MHSTPVWQDQFYVISHKLIPEFADPAAAKRVAVTMACHKNLKLYVNSKFEFVRKNSIKIKNLINFFLDK